jgi:hypothetical protein
MTDRKAALAAFLKMVRHDELARSAQRRADNRIPGCETARREHASANRHMEAASTQYDIVLKFLRGDEGEPS